MFKASADRTDASPMRSRIATRAVPLFAVALLALVAAACSPAPGTTLVDGGDYEIGVTVPSQQITNEFELPLGLGTCVTAVTTPEVDVPGTTVRLPAFELDAETMSVTLPEVSVRLPRSRVSAGTFSLTCLGHVIASIGVTIELDALVSVQSATLDVERGLVTLAEPTLTVTDAVATFAGMPEGTPPVPLDPIVLALPELEIKL